MWNLDTIRVVPRPSMRSVATAITVLAVYVAFRNLEVMLFGRPVHPLALAISLRLGLVLVGNFLEYDAGQATAQETRIRVWLLYFGLVGALGILLISNPALIQHLWGLFLLAFATVQLAFVRFSPGDVPLLPSVWASTHRLSPRALELATMGVVLVAVTSEALIGFGSEMAWMVFVTLGALAINFLTNWVIVLMITTESSGHR